MNVETISEAFVEYLENEGVGTFGQNIFISQVPDSAPDQTFWTVTSGGTPIAKMRTGEQMKQYFILLYYRSPSAKDVERTLFRLEEKLNCASCVELTGFEVYDIECSQFPVDNDIDDESRKVGFLQANIKIYKKEC